mmetsp:Transcript_50037/g.95559  ORF Transcript_50037/g.95559 Transcript_50037/m.95559 type:complete len:530 (-) Transcript_50037:408-1997(-)
MRAQGLRILFEVVDGAHGGGGVRPPHQGQVPGRLDFVHLLPLHRPLLVARRPLRAHARLKRLLPLHPPRSVRRPWRRLGLCVLHDAWDPEAAQVRALVGPGRGVRPVPITPSSVHLLDLPLQLSQPVGWLMQRGRLLQLLFLDEPQAVLHLRPRLLGQPIRVRNLLSQLVHAPHVHAVGVHRKVQEVSQLVHFVLENADHVRFIAPRANERGDFLVVHVGAVHSQGLLYLLLLNLGVDLKHLPNVLVAQVSLTAAVAHLWAVKGPGGEPPCRGGDYGGLPQCGVDEVPLVVEERGDLVQQPAVGGHVLALVHGGVQRSQSPLQLGKHAGEVGVAPLPCVVQPRAHLATLHLPDLRQVRQCRFVQIAHELVLVGNLHKHLWRERAARQSLLRSQVKGISKHAQGSSVRAFGVEVHHEISELFGVQDAISVFIEPLERRLHDHLGPIHLLLPRVHQHNRGLVHIELPRVRPSSGRSQLVGLHRLLKRLQRVRLGGLRQRLHSPRDGGPLQQRASRPPGSWRGAGVLKRVHD